MFHRQPLFPLNRYLLFIRFSLKSNNHTDKGRTAADPGAWYLWASFPFFCMAYSAGTVSPCVKFEIRDTLTGSQKTYFHPINKEVPIMSLRKFMTENRTELDAFILKNAPGSRLNDEERRLWILNDEKLYNWARSAGVCI